MIAGATDVRAGATDVPAGATIVPGGATIVHALDGCVRASGLL
jgi:hypothetical protein